MPRVVKTLAQMVTDVRNILEEPVPARWTDAKLKEYLNKCQEDFAVLAERLKTEEVTLDAGDGTLPFPDDFLMMSEMYWMDGDQKREIKPGTTNVPLDDSANTSPATGPTRYYMVNGVFEIRPVQAVDTDIIIVYYEDPDDMVEDDDRPHFNHTQDALIAGAVWMAYRDDNDPREQLWSNNYSIEKQKWLVIETQNYQDGFQQISNW